MTSFPHLLSPLRLANVTLPNRLVMGAMHTRLETLDRPLERLAAFYEERAKGGAALLLTGGFSPNSEGRMEDDAPIFNGQEQIKEHLPITNAVKKHGGLIAMQILHAGRYARVSTCVAPSPLQARINRYKPRELTTQEVYSTIRDYAHTAALAREAGYNGVEIMGSEGYLINEFTAGITNQRFDEFGGSFDNRIRLAIEVVKAVRAKVGRDFVIIYRISAIDLMEGGLKADEIARLAKAIEAAGADLINTGIGWHEAAVPTIAASVPRGAWADAIKNVKHAVTIPVMASNRINTPEMAESFLQEGVADLISMARPLLADPYFAAKVKTGRVDEINTCIACNQACLDRIFSDKTASCLVNPKAGRELEFSADKALFVKNIAVVGGGAAGMSFALEAAQKGHKVTLFEATDKLGGQLNLAKSVSSKHEFNETLRYFNVCLQKEGVKIHFNTMPSVKDLNVFDSIVITTGITPRMPSIKGINHASVVSYNDILSGKVQPKDNVAVIGAGGIGFDVADYLTSNPSEAHNPQAFFDAWGVAATVQSQGGVKAPVQAASPRKVTLLQRKNEPLGKHLSKTTGWVLKAKLKKAGVAMLTGVSYEKIDDDGLHILHNGEAKLIPATQIIICAGQESNKGLYEACLAQGLSTRIIGGAKEAGELDAMRAIDEAVRLAQVI